MKRLSAVILILAASLVVFGQGTAPRMTSVTPDTGKADAEYTIAGENLDKNQVKEVFLTLGSQEIKVSIVTQKADAITVKVPVDVKPGRYGLMILNADCTMYIEQPVKITIE
jgi:hypothetical protein